MSMLTLGEIEVRREKDTKGKVYFTVNHGEQIFYSSTLECAIHIAAMLY